MPKFKEGDILIHKASLERAVVISVRPKHYRLSCGISSYLVDVDHSVADVSMVHSKPEDSNLTKFWKDFKKDERKNNN